MTINERIKFIIDSQEDGVVLRFARKIGVAHTSIASMLPDSRESKPGYEVLAKITEGYPTISERWLLTGEGEAFKDSADNVAPPGHLPKNVASNIGSSSNKIHVGTGSENSDIDYYRQRIRELEKKYDSLLDKYEQLLTKKE